VIAQRRDSAPGRVLADAAIVAAAEMDPKSERELLLLPGFGGRSVRRLATHWLKALDEARSLPDEALPVTPQFEGPPPRIVGPTRIPPPRNGWRAAARSSRRRPSATPCHRRT
jgi:ribonuclease D